MQFSSYGKKRVRLDGTSLLSFIFCFLGGAISHLIIFHESSDRGLRAVKNLIFGICYDVMNGSEIAIVGILIAIVLAGKFVKSVHVTLVFVYLFFQFVDIGYVKQFGTHLPFSTIEYLDDLGNFRSNFFSILLNYHVWCILIIPFAGYVACLRKLAPPIGGKRRYWHVSYGVTLLLLLIVAGISGSYPNSYAAKNLNDPLTSSAAIYFYWSRDFEKETRIEKPETELEYVAHRLAGKRSKASQYVDLPLARTVFRRSCDKRDGRQSIAGSICGSSNRPNILFLFLESFRAVDVGAYGSKLGITPFFDQWSRKGIFFRHFFANGFQTRHGLVAAHCSIMPNYGPAIMKKYAKNRFYCLPELLKKEGYRTFCVFGSDAAFDDQIHFLPKIGIDAIHDRLTFDSDAEILGWGVSDREMFQKWIELLDREKQPFFSSALTITNHHPFDVPDEYKLHRGQDDTHKYYEAVHYTDAMLDEFLTAAEKRPWYRNSLIFIFSDTANYQQPQEPHKNFDDFIITRTQIPLLIVGGLVQYPVVENRYFSQIDLAPTVLDLLGVEYTSHWIGTSMLDPSEVGLAYTNRPGSYWGVMSLKGRYYHEADARDHFFGSADKRLMQHYKRLGKSWLKVTQWLLQENLYWRD